MKGCVVCSTPVRSQQHWFCREHWREYGELIRAGQHPAWLRELLRYERRLDNSERYARNQGIVLVSLEEYIKTSYSSDIDMLIHHSQKKGFRGKV
jgi:hypothetical protein